MTRRTLRQIVDGVLKRRQIQQLNDTPRTRISTPHWARASEAPFPERDPSEWVWKSMEQDWDAVKRGDTPRWG